MASLGTGAAVEYVLDGEVPTIYWDGEADGLPQLSLDDVIIFSKDGEPCDRACHACLSTLDREVDRPSLSAVGQLLYPSGAANGEGGAAGPSAAGADGDGGDAPPPHAVLDTIGDWCIEYDGIVARVWMTTDHAWYRITSVSPLYESTWTALQRRLQASSRTIAVLQEAPSVTLKQLVRSVLALNREPGADVRLREDDVWGNAEFIASQVDSVSEDLSQTKALVSLRNLSAAPPPPPAGEPQTPLLVPPPSDALVQPAAQGAISSGDGTDRSMRGRARRPVGPSPVEVLNMEEERLRLSRKARKSAGATPGSGKGQRATSAVSAAAGRKAADAAAEGAEEGTAPLPPMTAFSIFAQHRRRLLRAAEPNVRFGDLCKRVAAAWRAAEPWERAPYLNQAAEEQLRHSDELKAFLRTKQGTKLMSATARKQLTLVAAAAAAGSHGVGPASVSRGVASAGVDGGDAGGQDAAGHEAAIADRGGEFAGDAGVVEEMVDEAELEARIAAKAPRSLHPFARERSKLEREINRLQALVLKRAEFRQVAVGRLADLAGTTLGTAERANGVAVEAGTAAARDEGAEHGGGNEGEVGGECGDGSGDDGVERNEGEAAEAEEGEEEAADVCDAYVGPDGAGDAPQMRHARAKLPPRATVEVLKGCDDVAYIQAQLKKSTLVGDALETKVSKMKAKLDKVVEREAKARAALREREIALLVNERRRAAGRTAREETREEERRLKAEDRGRRLAEKEKLKQDLADARALMDTFPLEDLELMRRETQLRVQFGATPDLLPPATPQEAFAGRAQSKGSALAAYMYPVLPTENIPTSLPPPPFPAPLPRLELAHVPQDLVSDVLHVWDFVNQLSSSIHLQPARLALSTLQSMLACQPGTDLMKTCAQLHLSLLESAAGDALVAGNEHLGPLYRMLTVQGLRPYRDLVWPEGLRLALVHDKRLGDVDMQSDQDNRGLGDGDTALERQLSGGGMDIAGAVVVDDVAAVDDKGAGAPAAAPPAAAHRTFIEGSDRATIREALAKDGYESLCPRQRVQLLAWLVDRVLESAVVREKLEANAEGAAELRKEIKGLEGEIEAAQAEAEQLHGANGGKDTDDGNAPGGGGGGDDGGPGSRRRLTQQQTKVEAAEAADLANKRFRQLRKLDRELAGRKVRNEPLGHDRFHCAYWRLGGAASPGRVFVHVPPSCLTSPAEPPWYVAETKAQLEGLVSYLHPKAQRESELLEELQAQLPTLVNGMRREADLNPPLQLPQPPPPPGDGYGGGSGRRDSWRGPAQAQAAARADLGQVEAQVAQLQALLISAEQRVAALEELMPSPSDEWFAGGKESGRSQWAQTVQFCTSTGDLAASALELEGAVASSGLSTQFWNAEKAVAWRASMAKAVHTWTVAYLLAVWDDAVVLAVEENGAEVVIGADTAA